MARLVCLMLLVLLHGPMQAAKRADFSSSGYWIDSSGQADVHSAASQSFVEFGGALRLGYVVHPVWIRLDLSAGVLHRVLEEGPPQAAKRPAVIRVSPYPIDRIELHWNSAGQWLTEVAGDRVPRRNRELCPDDTHCFVIDDPPPGGFQVYLKVTNQGAMYVDLKVLSIDEVPGVSAMRVAFTSASLTCALGLLCAGLLILIFEYRSRLLLTYCAFQITIVMFMIAVAGLLPAVLPGWRPESIDLATHMILQLRVGATTLLCWAVVTAYGPPTLYHRLCTGLMLASGASIAMVSFGAGTSAIELASVVFLLNPLVQIYGVIATRRHAEVQSIFLLVAFAIFATLAAIRFPLIYGIIDAGLLVEFPAFFGDLRLNGLPISIGVFIILLIERAKVKAERELELVRLREGAAQARAATEQLRDRQGFIDMLAHELQNPLATIRFAIRSLHRAVGPATDAGRHLHSVDASARRIGDFIEHVSTMSRIEMMHVPSEVSRIPVAELIEEILAEYADPERFSVEADREACVNADRQLLTVLIENFVSNARKYSTPGTDIAIVVSPHGDRLRVAVINEVPPDRIPDRARLFERFYRHPEIMGIPGSGLGLSVARLAAQKMGAHLDARIEGSRVCFFAELSA